MEYFAKTDIGNYREKNEDYFYADSNLFIVADGMGGHRAGEVASKTAVETFVKNFYKKINPENIKQALSFGISSANKEVYKKSIAKLECGGMGTTFTCCYIHNNTACMVHVGDTRLYVKSEDNFKLLTSDHTIVGELYRSGKISYEETFNHPKKNFLTNVLGIAESMEPDFFTVKLKPGSTILLCSDGLNSMLRDSYILKIINKFSSSEDTAKNLVSSA
ncbi:MAG: Stp1/IreP family PP2C-type Ser/Thr phosphatase, partial [Bacteroidales bacterium]|nr:Stp1/IreP family PP2C-type Ser/Thr phosphatase [Bacteroidales bacterium]